MKITLIQSNNIVGNLKNNYSTIIEACRNTPSDMIIFPELFLSGYDCKDLFLDPYFIKQCHRYINLLLDNLPKNKFIIFGTPYLDNHKLYNAAIGIFNHKIQIISKKQNLPNYSVFNEQRYFTPGDTTHAFTFKNESFKLLICFDIWKPEKLQPSKPTDHTIVINASPFYHGSFAKRIQTIQNYSEMFPSNIFYCNQIGAHDSNVYDGTSLIMNKNQNIIAISPRFTEHTLTQNLLNISKGIHLSEYNDGIADIFLAIKLGIQDYLNKNNIQKVCIALSGGIDSALTLAITYLSIPSEKIIAINMPSKFSSQKGINNSKSMCENLGIQLISYPIDPLMESYQNILESRNFIEGKIAHQNLQARIRSNLLMYVCNLNGAVAFCTSNQSELAVGYSTLYGDSVGAYAPLSNLFKKQVYQLSKWLNTEKEIIPFEIIYQEPSAELFYNQKDSDDLPCYDKLDPLIDDWMNKLEHRDKSQDHRFNFPEFKRNQAPIGPRVNFQSFNDDWRHLISSQIKLDD